MHCKEAIPLIHNYLDGSLGLVEMTELRAHLRNCEACGKHMKRLEITEAMLHSLSIGETPVPQQLTDRIMGALPDSRRSARPSWVRWVRRHPAVSVAAVFLLVMMTSFMTLWNQGSQLAVSGAELDQLVFRGNTVMVPAGRVVHGNLVVENGEVQVEGEVDGNLTVIDGSVAMASTAKVTGEVTKVNQAIDWLWYKLGSLFAAGSKT